MDSSAYNEDSSAYNEGRRWSHMITNLIKAWNSLFKGTHNLPITTLVQPTYYRFGPLFSLRALMAEARLGSSDSFTKHCMTVIREHYMKVYTSSTTQGLKWSTTQIIGPTIKVCRYASIQPCKG